MNRLSQKIEDFLAQKYIAVAGVSRNAKGEAANAIYHKLKQTGYIVYPLNPRTDTIESDLCYPNLKAISEPVDAVVIVTKPEISEQIVRECAETGVSRVWLHRSFGEGSVSQTTVNFCKENNISIIAGGCPMMFCQPVDFPHKCMRWILQLSGKLPN